MHVPVRSAVGVNWSRTYAYEAPELVLPESVDELQELVAAAPKVGVLGTRHSFNGIADTAGTLVSLQRMPRDVQIDAETGTVRVSGQLRYGDVVEQLDAAGFALANLASLPHISIAGACATATHGSGVGNGNLATSVVGMELVRADGELVTLTGDDLAGAAVHLGALGVVTHLTLQLVPAFEVTQQVFRDLAWSTVVEHLDQLLGCAYSVSLFTDLRHDSCDAWVKSSTGPLPRTLLGAAVATEPVHPVPGGAGGDCTVQLAEPGPWYARLPHFRLEFTPSRGEEIQSEYFVPRAAAGRALAALDRLAPELAPVLQVCEVRTVAADRLWLSPAYGIDLLALHFTWHDRPGELARVLPLLEDALRPDGVRPHWAKIFTATAQDVAPAYPRLDDFRALAARWDPERTFANEFLERMVLGPA